MLGLCILALLQWTVVTGHQDYRSHEAGEVNHTHEIKAEYLKKKWTMENVIRDLDHIKEDVRDIIELADTGTLSSNELTFYLVRMHDFDDNGGLDGIELRVALMHSTEHMQQNPNESSDERLEKVLDDVMELDANMDGIVDYGELKRGIEKEEVLHQIMELDANMDGIVDYGELKRGIEEEGA